MASVTPPRQFVGASRGALFITLAVVLLSEVPGILNADAKAFTYLACLAYIVAERRHSGRSWEEIGIKVRGFWTDVARHWWLILTAVILQLSVALMAKLYWPAFLEHIRGRIPFHASVVARLVLTMGVVTFFEELIYRGLLQQRLAWYLTPVLAVSIASVVFGLQHFTPGPWGIVTADMAGVAIDGFVFGWIFVRCRSACVSWVAHFTSDVVGLAVLLQI